MCVCVLGVLGVLGYKINYIKTATTPYTAHRPHTVLRRSSSILNENLTGKWTPFWLAAALCPNFVVDYGKHVQRTFLVFLECNKKYYLIDIAVSYKEEIPDLGKLLFWKMSNFRSWIMLSSANSCLLLYFVNKNDLFNPVFPGV